MKMVTVYDVLNDKYYRENLADVIEEIKNGKYKDLVEEIRNFMLAGRIEQAEDALNRLLWFIPAGLLDEELCGDLILEYSNLVTIEVVDVYAQDAQELIETIESITTTYCWFQSVDCTRITILVAVSTDSIDHELAFLQVAEFYSKRLNHDVVPVFRFITKPVYFSYSPQLYLNPNCEYFDVRKEDETSYYSYRD